MPSKYGFFAIPHITGTGTDGSRLAAQIVSGIGFLFGGVIVHEGSACAG